MVKAIWDLATCRKQFSGWKLTRQTDSRIGLDSLTWNGPGKMSLQQFFLPARDPPPALYTSPTNVFVNRKRYCNHVFCLFTGDI